MSDTNQKEKPAKFWDFNPRRGALCFCAALFLAPVSAAVDYLLRMNVGWQPVLFGSLIVAAIAGIWGTLTEHIDF
ncbi:MAG: hypothetical protein H6915_02545 [Novosphingobium sp.]|nr:hypothetical protein [Novosphingobium sp.]MCP5388622.1 hypothetical protein [Novosphingobium sp.]